MLLLALDKELLKCQLDKPAEELWYQAPPTHKQDQAKRNLIPNLCQGGGIPL